MSHAQAKPQAVPHQILLPCFIADLLHFPGIFLKYNRVELQYGSFSYPPSKKISLQMRALPVICHNIDLLGALRGVTHCPVNNKLLYTSSNYEVLADNVMLLASVSSIHI